MDFPKDKKNTGSLYCYLQLLIYISKLRILLLFTNLEISKKQLIA